MINWKKIETVFLDMDGTLLDLHFDNYFWREYVPSVYAREKSVGILQAKEILFPLFQKMEGTIEWYSVDYWSQELNLDIVQLKREIKHLIQVHPFAIEFLTRLQALNYRVVLLTNAHQKSLMLKMEMTQLENHFDRMISTHEIGLPKENKKFWDSLQSVEPFNKQTCLLVDDSLAVLRTAKCYGLANIMAISVPDSKSEANIIDEFDSVKNFSEMMPSRDV